MKAPAGVKISVEPNVLVFMKKFEKQSYSVNVEVGSWRIGDVLDGAIVWVDVKGNYQVRSPLVVV